MKKRLFKKDFGQPFYALTVNAFQVLVMFLVERFSDSLGFNSIQLSLNNILF
jgi:hypothetical protein